MKQFGRMLHSHLSKYLLNEDYNDYNIYSCVFSHRGKKNIRFAIVTSYVDNLNLIETFKELNKTSNYLK